MRNISYISLLFALITNVSAGTYVTSTFPCQLRIKYSYTVCPSDSSTDYQSFEEDQNESEVTKTNPNLEKDKVSTPLNKEQDLLIDLHKEEEPKTQNCPIKEVEAAEANLNKSDKRENSSIISETKHSNFSLSSQAKGVKHFSTSKFSNLSSISKIDNIASVESWSESSSQEDTTSCFPNRKYSKMKNSTTISSTFEDENSKLNGIHSTPKKPLSMKKKVKNFFKNIKNSSKESNTTQVINSLSEE